MIKTEAEYKKALDKYEIDFMRLGVLFVDILKYANKQDLIEEDEIGCYISK